jgi:hypothetical protein
MTRRLMKTMPWIGGALALLTLGGSIRRKGWIRGAANTALDFMPFVGTAKYLAESRRGRDFFPDKKPVTTFPGERPAAAR